MIAFLVEKKILQVLHIKICHPTNENRRLKKCGVNLRL